MPGSDSRPLLDAPAAAIAELELATSASLARSAQDAALVQQLGNVVMISAAAAGVARILGLKPAELFDRLERDARARGISC